MNQNFIILSLYMKQQAPTEKDDTPKSLIEEVVYLHPLAYTFTLYPLPFIFYLLPFTFCLLPFTFYIYRLPFTFYLFTLLVLTFFPLGFFCFSYSFLAFTFYPLLFTFYLLHFTFYLSSSSLESGRPPPWKMSKRKQKSSSKVLESVNFYPFLKNVKT